MLPSAHSGSHAALQGADASWRDLLRGRDDAIVSDAGLSGELLVARVRLWTFCAIALSPLVGLVNQAGQHENVTASLFAGLGIAVAALILRLLRRGRRIHGLAYLSSIFDITLISLTQYAYLADGLPSAAANSRTMFAAYFIAMGATCLRWDPRLCLTVGALAVAQYAGVAIWAGLSWNAHGADVLSHGQFVWGQQLGLLVLLVAFALLCVAIVRRSLLLRISSTHDALTGLMNRAFLEERLGEELSRATRQGGALCVAMVDVDRFKQVNDEFGHDAGDAALREVAGVLRRSVRRSDLVARWGGEEFALVLPDTTLREAYRRIDWIRATLAATPIQLTDGTRMDLTLSGGIATYPFDGQTPRELFVAADMGLLQAKRSGRDRIVVRTPDDAVGHRPLGVPMDAPVMMESRTGSCESSGN